MFVKLSKKGMNYYAILATVELISLDEIMEAAIYCCNIPQAETLIAAAYLLSDEIGFPIYSNMLEEIDEEEYYYLLGKMTIDE